jgi:hypothetical protein
VKNTEIQLRRAIDRLTVFTRAIHVRPAISRIISAAANQAVHAIGALENFIFIVTEKDAFSSAGQIIGQAID